MDEAADGSGTQENNGKTTMSTPIRIALILGVLAFAGCQQDANDAASDEDEEETPAIPVETSRAIRGDIYAMYSGTAPIEAFAEAEVIAKVAGEIERILVEEGDDVESGQVLARLDGDRLRFELMQAEANLRKLERDYQRNVDLRDKSLISVGDFEKIKYEMDALEASYNLAKLELSYTEIRAPIDGVVSERFVKVGNTIPVNAPMFRVTSLEPLVSYLHVPEREYRRIQSGQPATIQVDALSETNFEATVARVSPVVDPETGTFKITVEVSDPTRRLKPGMFGRINIVYDMRAQALQVPRSAIVDEAGEMSLFVVEDSIAHQRAIEIGYTNRGQIEILSGLTGDEDIIVVGQTALKQGSKVSVIKTSTGDSAAAKNAESAN